MTVRSTAVTAGGRGRGVGARTADCTSRYGHILFTSGPHGCYQVSKPTRTVRQEVVRSSEQRTQGRTTHVVDSLTGNPRPCVPRLHHCCCFPRPLDVIAISSSGSSLHCSASVRACCRSRASSRGLHHAHGQRQSYYCDSLRARVCGSTFLRNVADEEKPSL